MFGSHVTRMSQRIANWSPPPNAAPSSAEILGMGGSHKPMPICHNDVTNGLPSASGILARSLRSAPGKKLQPISLSQKLMLGHCTVLQ